MSKIDLISKIQFIIRTQFSSIYAIDRTGPYQVLPVRARIDQRAMAMKGYSVFPKAPA